MDAGKAGTYECGKRKGPAVKSMGDGWLSWRWALLASTLYQLSHWLSSNPDISQKHKMGDISIGIANTL
jgi:hypothetical protein